MGKNLLTLLTRLLELPPELYVLICHDYDLPRRQQYDLARLYYTRHGMDPTQYYYLRRAVIYPALSRLIGQYASLVTQPKFTVQRLWNKIEGPHPSTNKVYRAHFELCRTRLRGDMTDAMILDRFLAFASTSYTRTIYYLADVLPATPIRRRFLWMDCFDALSDHLEVKLRPSMASGFGHPKNIRLLMYLVDKVPLNRLRTSARKRLGPQCKGCVYPVLQAWASE